MISIWRKRIGRRLAAAGRGLCLLPGLVGVAGLPGCAWVRAQAQHRSDECRQLCQQADQAQESGQMDQADRLLNEALRKSPRDLEIRRQLAESLWQAGRQKDALDQMTQLAEAHPQDVRLAITLAEWLSEAGRYEEALAWLQPGQVAEPELTRVLELKAEIESAQGNDAAALMTYQRLARQEASQPEAYLQMGKIHLKHDHPDRAAPLFRAVPSHPRATLAQKAIARWDLGVAYAQLERWTDAAAQLAEAVPDRDMTADDWHALAYAQYRADNRPGAKASLNHALALEPRHTAGQTLQAMLLDAEPSRTTDARQLLPAGFERPQEADRRPGR